VVVICHSFPRLARPLRDSRHTSEAGRGLERFRAGQPGFEKEVPILAGLIWTIIVVLFVLWLLGFAIHIGGGLIHLLLVIALVLLVFNIITGRGARV
jgi:Flp pilus assembly protein TadB